VKRVFISDDFDGELVRDVIIYWSCNIYCFLHFLHAYLIIHRYCIWILIGEDLCSYPYNVVLYPPCKFFYCLLWVNTLFWGAKFVMKLQCYTRTS
jgi:hypothetical protein